jgi:hypothetical protein
VNKKKKACNPLRLQAFDFIGADERNRTSDLLITNQLLYQLSYISKDSDSIKESSAWARA